MKKEQKRGAVKYRIMRLQPDGTRVEHQLSQNGAGFKLCTVVDDGLEITQIDADSLIEALGATPELLLVGTGFTEIDAIGIETFDLLGKLIVEDPDASVPQPEDWGPVDEDGELLVELPLPGHWHYDEEILTIQAPEGFEIVPRLLWINGDRACLLRGPDGFSALGLLDGSDDWRQPVVTTELLSWGFYNETGGPCTMQGGASLGWVSPQLWGFVRWGDLEPQAFVFPAPAPESQAEALASWILGEQWEFAYLLSAIGTPGLDEESREQIWYIDDVQGQHVSSNLGDELDAQVVGALIESSSVLAEAAAGLRDPDSPRGQKIYARLRRIIDGRYSERSWFDVHEAMSESMVEAVPHVPLVELPDALREDVEMALAQPKEADLDREIQSLTQLESDAAAALELLGAEAGSQPSLGAVRALVEQRPEDEARLMGAFWVLYDWRSLGGADGIAERLSALRKGTDGARSRREAAEADGWPAAWPIVLHSLWVKLGGSAGSALAWAEAGWQANIVLTSERLGNYWNPPIVDRVTMSRVPTPDGVKKLTSPSEDGVAFGL